MAPKGEKGELLGWQPGWPPLPYMTKRDNAALFPLHVLLSLWSEDAADDNARKQKLHGAAGNTFANPNMIEKLHIAFGKLKKGADRPYQS